MQKLTPAQEKRFDEIEVEYHTQDIGSEITEPLQLDSSEEKAVKSYLASEIQLARQEERERILVDGMERLNKNFKQSNRNILLQKDLEEITK